MPDMNKLAELGLKGNKLEGMIVVELLAWVGVLNVYDSNAPIVDAFREGMSTMREVASNLNNVKEGMKLDKAAVVLVHMLTSALANATFDIEGDADAVKRVTAEYVEALDRLEKSFENFLSGKEPVKANDFRNAN